MSETMGGEVAVVVRLTGEMHAALAKRAAAEDRTVASVLRTAAREYLWREAAQREHASLRATLSSRYRRNSGSA